LKKQFAVVEDKEDLYNLGLGGAKQGTGVKNYGKVLLEAIVI
jgi:hypothetical protein